MHDSYNLPNCNLEQPINNDLKHRDWLLKTTQALIVKVDPVISTKIIDTPDGGKRLLVNHVSESSIQLLEFLTNTDQNNNYLYLEKFSLTLERDLEPLEFPGLSEVMVKIFQDSDANAFINGLKTHKPFSPSSFNDVTSNQFVDIFSSLVPFVPNTSNKIKFYNLVLNPDDSCSQH